MRLFFNSNKKLFFCIVSDEEKSIPRDAGFKKCLDDKRKWSTHDLDCAAKLFPYAEGKTKEILQSKLKAIRASIKESKSTNSNLKIPVPEGLSYLPFQKAGIAFTIKRNNSLNADEPRLGKTIQTIGHINYKWSKNTNCKILIMCPATIKLNWYQELQRWLVNRKLTISICSGFNPCKLNTNISIINFHILEKWEKEIKKVEWDLLVIDECHALRNMRAIRTKMVFGNDEIRGKKDLIIKPIPHKSLLLLTGTPIVNRPTELYVLLRALKVPIANDFYKFACRYTNPVNNGYGWQFKGGKNLLELQHKLREGVMIRRLKKDVLKDLPPKRRQIIEISEEDYSLSKAMKNEKEFIFFKKEKEEELFELMKLGKEINNEKVYRKAVKELNEFKFRNNSKIMEIRHQTSLAKIPAVVDHCEQVLQQVDKIVLYAHHLDVIKKLEMGLKKYNPVIIDGGVAAEKRLDIVNKFNGNKDVRICIVGIQLAVGFSLASCDWGIFAEISWTPGEMEQAEDRLFDVNKRSSIMIQHIVVNGSIDANMAKLIVEKQDIINKTLDN